MRERTTRHTSRLIAVVGLAAATLGVNPQPAAAATITVNTTNVDTNFSDGACSLAEAIQNANNDTAFGRVPGECQAGSAFDFILLPSGSIFVDPPGLPTIASTIQIVGQSGSVIDGLNAGANPGLRVQTGELILDGVTVQNFAGGGIISNNSVLTVVNSWIRFNGSSSSPVGGISFQSPSNKRLTIEQSTMSSNSTSGSGGGVSINGSVEASVVNSTIAHNNAAGVGGGIDSSPTTGSTVTVVSSTIVGNIAPVSAGINNGGTVPLVVTNSIIADNIGGSDVDGGTITSGGGNVFGFGPNTGDFGAADDTVGQSAGVAALTDNGGRTPTMALQPGSAAIDRITAASLPTDQRGVDRPQGARPDSGAYEFRPELTMLPFPCTAYSSGFSPLTQGEAPLTIQVTGNCGIPSNATSVVFTLNTFSTVAPGNVRLAADGVIPNGGVVNFTNNGLVNTNTVTIELSLTGAVDLSANGGTAPSGAVLTGVSLEAVAYYAPTPGLDYFPVTPCAVADSRPSEGASGGFVGPFTTPGGPAIDVIGAFPAAQGGGNTDCGVPASADTVVVNVVAVNAMGPGFLTVPGITVVAFDNNGMNDSAVAYLTPVVSGAPINAITTAGTHVRVVVLGYLDDADTGSAYTPVTPCAAFDTRTGEGATGAFAGARVGDNVTTYQITGTIPGAQGGNGANCGVPAGASAVLINLVAVNSVRAGNLQAYATGTTPTGGVVNFAALTPPMNNSNAVPVPISALGRMDIRTNAGPSGVGQPTTHIRGIILGYYTN